MEITKDMLIETLAHKDIECARYVRENIGLKETLKQRNIQIADLKHRLEEAININNANCGHGWDMTPCVMYLLIKWEI